MIINSFSSTARTRDNAIHPMHEASTAKATPFSYGAGHIRPNRAMDPGLVYDLTTNDYLDFLCAIGYNQTMVKLFANEPYECPKNASVLNLNYPSITVPKLSGSVTVTRRVKNVGHLGIYKVLVREPVGVSVSVEPKSLVLGHDEEKCYSVTLKDKGYGLEGYYFGGLTWSDGKHYVRSPIVVSTSHSS